MPDSKDAISTIADFVRNPSPSRILALLLVIAIAVGGFLLFKSRTFYFTGQQTLTNVEILERLVALRAESELTETEEAIRQQLLARITESESTAPPVKPIPIWAQFSFSGDRFIYGLLPWLLMGLIFFFTTKDNRGAAFGGVIAIGVVFAGLATLFPHEHLITKLVYIPFGLMGVGLASILLVGLTQARKAVAKVKQESPPEE